MAQTDRLPKPGVPGPAGAHPCFEPVGRILHGATTSAYAQTYCDKTISTNTIASQAWDSVCPICHAQGG